jgi:hypothetical protein
MESELVREGIVLFCITTTTTLTTILFASFFVLSDNIEIVWLLLFVERLNYKRGVLKIEHTRDRHTTTTKIITITIIKIKVLCSSTRAGVGYSILIRVSKFEVGPFTLCEHRPNPPLSPCAPSSPFSSTYMYILYILVITIKQCLKYILYSFCAF